MPSKEPGQSGYCNCMDCKEAAAKRARKVKTGRRSFETRPPRPDMEHFWDEVHRTSAIRDEGRRKRR